MPLTVAPLLDYDSLVSLVQADDYWVRMNAPAWALASIPAREAALRRGTQFILAKRLIAAATAPTVVRAVQEATSEAAMRALTDALYRDVEPAPILLKAVGPIRIAYGAPGNSGQVRIPIIDQLLSGLTIAYGPVFSERV